MRRLDPIPADGPSITPFITRPLSIALDLVRALAALAVLAGHAAQLGHLAGWPFTIAFQHNAVIVFFVLSGLVIATSVDRRAQTLGGFALARASRILPVALPALALSLAVMALDAALAPPAVFAEDARGVPASEWLFALAFLSESWQADFAPNPPYWSLCYEVWFYALFAAATFLRGWARIGWLGLLALVAGPKVLLLLPCWLVGVALARLPALRRIPPLAGPPLIALALAALWLVPAIERPLFLALHAAMPFRLGYSMNAASDLILAVALALGIAGLRSLLARTVHLERVARPIRQAADMSFSLYLVHWPLLKLLRVLRAPEQGAAGFVAVLALVVVASAAFASVTEHRRHAVRALIERALAGWREARA